MSVPPPQSGGVFSCSLRPGAGLPSCSKICTEYLLCPPWVSASFRGAPISSASLGSQGNICFKKEPAGNPAPEEFGPDRLSANEQVRDVLKTFQGCVQMRRAIAFEHLKWFAFLRTDVPRCGGAPSQDTHRKLKTSQVENVFSTPDLPHISA